MPAKANVCFLRMGGFQRKEAYLFISLVVLLQTAAAERQPAESSTLTTCRFDSDPGYGKTFACLQANLDNAQLELQRVVTAVTRVADKRESTAFNEHQRLWHDLTDAECALQRSMDGSVAKTNALICMLCRVRLR